MHALVAICTVATTTHLVLWIRRALKDKRHSVKALRNFARLAFLFYSVTFILGLVIYPTYKVKVRVGYLERVAIPSSIQVTEDKGPAPRANPAPLDIEESKASRGQRLARLFDMKEHLALLGWLAMVLCFFAFRFWDDGATSAFYRKSIFTLALLACLATWWSGIVGLVVSASRSIAAL